MGQLWSGASRYGAFLPEPHRSQSTVSSSAAMAVVWFFSMLAVGRTFYHPASESHCFACIAWGTAPCNANQRAKQISQEIVGLAGFMQTNLQTNAPVSQSSRTTKT